MPDRLPPGPLFLVFLVAVGAACAGPERTEAPVSEDVYVEVMSRLAAVRRASDPGRHSDPVPRSRADSLRRAVLREHGVDRAELKEFARVVGDEPERMRGLWTRIAARVDSLQSAGWPEDSVSGEEEP